MKLKKISLIFLFIVLNILLFIFFIYEPKNNSKNKNISNDIKINSNLKKQNILEPRYNTKFPSFNVYGNSWNKGRLAVADSGNNCSNDDYYDCDNSTMCNVVYYNSRVSNNSEVRDTLDNVKIYYKDYAKDKQNFLNIFKSMDIYFNYSSFHGCPTGINKGWCSYNDSYKSGSCFNLNIRDDAKINFSFSNSSDSQTWKIISDYWKAENKFILSYSLCDDYIDIALKLDQKIWWKSGSINSHLNLGAINDLKICVNSDYNFKNLTNNLEKEFNESNSFTFTTDTSSDISSENEIDPNEQHTKLNDGLSNKKFIEKEINRRYLNAFNQTLQEDFKNNIQVDLAFDDKNSYVNVLLADNNKIWSNGYEFRGRFKVNLIKHPTLINTDFRKRLKFEPMKIVNDKAELVEDLPYYNGNQTKPEFTYHNSVRFSFTANEKLQEKIFINDNMLEVYNGEFKTIFSDNRQSAKDTKLTKYEIKVYQNNKVMFECVIFIENFTADIQFKWEGWNPDEKADKLSPEYKQWLMITPSLNGKPNKFFDPTIDSKTGVRKQIISQQVKNIEYPFMVDPLNQFGNKVKQDEKDDPIKGYKKAYIAEAFVVNSGIAMLEVANEKTINKIIRYRTNINTLQHEDSGEKVEINNNYFSMSGLWHYVIYLNDLVEEKVDPSGNLPDKPTTLKAGSTIHKYIYINRGEKDYANFMDIKEFKENKNLFSLFSSIQGRHLLNFLVYENIITLTEQIMKLTYEEVIKFWKIYVSFVQSDKSLPPIENEKILSLDSLNISSLKINTKEQEQSSEDIVLQIKEHINKNILKLTNKAKEKIDYNIVSTKNIPLENIDLSDFIKLTEQEQTKVLNLNILSTNYSTCLTGRTTLKVINNAFFDKTKMLDISNIIYDNQYYNFTNSEQELKDNFINNYICQYVLTRLNKHKPKGVDKEYKYLNDYSIYIEFDKNIKVNNNEIEKTKYGYLLDDKNLANLKKYINIFLNTKNKIKIKVQIVASDDSILLSGINGYEIINDYQSKEKPPINPNKKEEPPKAPETSNDHNKKQFLFWLIPIIIFPLFLISIIIFLLIRRKRKKIVN